MDSRLLIVFQMDVLLKSFFPHISSYQRYIILEGYRDLTYNPLTYFDFGEICYPITFVPLFCFAGPKNQSSKSQFSLEDLCSKKPFSHQVI
jgi:hypothetical protein